ncbi:MAG: UDP-N-acetylglucosamine 2-epimerase (non-hydrolyzing) [Fimbriimonadaceae bacterium]|nr:UDP-N-acetylglucosamine 2-epimerase (non-hydrolyzing) [Fimbriimonadaceae bacterium]
MYKVVCIVGTRPDAIKTMPVMLALRARPEFQPVMLSTGQHREMLEQVFSSFGVRPDEDLGLMRHGQSLAELSARALEGLDAALDRHRPDMVFAQGDTTTTFIAALAAFYRGIPFGHVEAGLRTGDMASPFPEEFNRRAAALTAAQHYAPTEWAAENLRCEGFAPDSILVTGNTGIDAVLQMAGRLEQTWLPEHEGPVVLLTTHRRENWGAPQAAVARAVLRLCDAVPDLQVVVAMHRNPKVREVLQPILGGRPDIHLIEPPDYPQFVKLMQRSTLILTDSGGVQEEAPSFGIPVLVLRDTTERPEGVDAGCAELIGTDEEAVFARSLTLLTDPEAHARMARSASPYGDGQASDRIVDAALAYLTGRRGARPS